MPTFIFQVFGFVVCLVLCFTCTHGGQGILLACGTSGMHSSNMKLAHFYPKHAQHFGRRAGRKASQEVEGEGERAVGGSSLGWDPRWQPSNTPPPLPGRSLLASHGDSIYMKILLPLFLPERTKRKRNCLLKGSFLSLWKGRKKRHRGHACSSASSLSFAWPAPGHCGGDLSTAPAWAHFSTLLLSLSLGRRALCNSPPLLPFPPPTFLFLPPM